MIWWLLWLALWTSSLHLHSSTSGGEGTGFDIDVSWNFETNNNYEGWANSTAEEMQIDSRIENGELRASVRGGNPNIDSPNLFIDVSKRHYVVIRMMYMGGETKGKLLLRSGSIPSAGNAKNTDHSRNYWYNEITATPISSSVTYGSSYSMDKITDNNVYSYYLSNDNKNVYVTFDLGEYRTITSMKILSSGDSNSPKRCLLQKSMTSGVGPFETVASFTLDKITSDFTIDSTDRLNATIKNGYNRQIKEQTISKFNAHSRYWRILVIDNYGGDHIGIREVSFSGYSEQISAHTFDIDNTGTYKTYYIPIFQHVRGPLLRLRLEMEKVMDSTLPKDLKLYYEAFSVDFIRIARAPEVRRVLGCLDKYYDNSNFLNPQYNVIPHVEIVNNHLPIHSFSKGSMDLPYATTYDCPLSGGVDITVEGIGFGPKARIFIGGNECIIKSYGTNALIDARLESFVCTLPAGTPGSKLVRVENGILPGLFQESETFAYRNAPPVLASPIVSNIASYKVDLSWTPSGDVFDHMMITGYKILWFQPQVPSLVHNITVSNITYTSVRGLKPNTEYVFAVAGMCEGAYHEKSATLPTDLYGRRSPTPSALIGTFSAYTNITGTSEYDFDFAFFDANKTLEIGASSSSNMKGPTGQFGSEGHYGLVVVGSTNIQNCNVSSTCCDGYNATIGLASCGTGRTVCAVLPARMLAYEFAIDGVSRRQVPSNLPYPGIPDSNEIVIFTLDELKANKGADLPSSRCGPALRLTPSEARHSGSAWYKRKLNVGEGFDTTITFEISNPSLRCDRMDDVNTFCRSRGGDGFAFVIQNVAYTALGTAGSGLGYEGIFGSLAVELDTYHNYDNMDYYENHISVMTKGFRDNITANHSRALATTNRCPDLSAGVHSIRIKYEPTFDENAVPHPSFQVNGYTSFFFENADFEYGGEGDWGIGFGLLYIYIDDMYSPVITTPLNLKKTINLDDDRAIVGLTASTGDNTWQAHDILSWKFTSLYQDDFYEKPIILNGQGDHRCVNMTVCRHFTDYEHYMRKNNIMV